MSVQLACPSCGDGQRWHPQWIGHHRFTAQCGDCNVRWESLLPDLDMKVIALDTNAVSEMMKLLTPEFPESRRARVPAEWREVLRRLRTAARLHAITCPQSPTLARESSLFQFGPAIQKVAKIFDQELKFAPQFRVLGHQLNLAAKARVRNEPVKSLPRSFALNGGKLNQWSNWFRIEVGLGLPRNTPEQVAAARRELHANAQGVFERWKSDTGTLEQVYDEERRAFGRIMAREYVKHLERLRQNQPDALELLNVSSEHMFMIRLGLRGHSAEDPPVEDVLGFALSDHAANVPTNRIRAALYAFEARQFAGGMSTIAPSFWMDVEMISTTLPYCDAMLVEGHFATALHQVRRLLPVECRSTPVFSTRQLGPFCEYLDGVIAAVPPNQRLAAERLYGTVESG